MSSSAGDPDSSTASAAPTDPAAPLDGLPDGSLDGLRQAIDELIEVGVSPTGVDEAVSLLQGLEREARRLSALQVSLMDSIDRQGPHEP